MNRCFKIALGAILLFPFSAFSQTVEQTGWLAWFNSYKLKERWAMHLDVQLRSADDLDYSRNLLVRPGLTYHINQNQNVTAGYAWIETFDNPDLSTDKNLTEHRIWEQYVLSYKLKGLPLTHRFRLEQRFIERPAEDIFSQRLRYFARVMVPFKKDKAAFNKGVFAALQNEVFLNLQNKNKLNDKVFDQNRAYVAIGYRVNRRFDLEAGYLNQYVDGLGSNTVNHAGQLALYTRF
ncbi:DUF2490 domain-containing protein [Desertivirga xinjiangensis]|uniref:DUF2490 domain-containing protein n=1 Tax=Desertivirga xinjiangensis TaxID=539206 RepID=UPI00210AF9BB|nr:DUF2490 domain-containing protein [Pedobacter xinjiangensis]